VGFFDRAIAATLPLVPKFVVRRVSAPYIAGESLADAVATVRSLNEGGMSATLDLLGEELTTAEECGETSRRYVEIVRELERTGADSGVSVKLSAFGLRLDPALARELLEPVLDAAREAGRFVRIDMEDSSLTDPTLDVWRHFRAEGYERVGVVLQACLHRTPDDARRLAEEGADVRVVKGIYIEPESISWRDPDAIRKSYVETMRALLEKGCRVASATHDTALVEATYDLMDEFGLGPGELEFQMLLGVREKLRETILGKGHRMRVYVPFGEQWYAYGTRRLRENPAIAGHVTRALFGRMFGRRG